MHMPGFAAELSLYRSKTNYLTIGSYGSLLGAGAIAPQLPPSPGCGECAPYTWPDGRSTGVCHQSCCDFLGRCTDNICSCGGGGAIGVGSTGVNAL